MRIFDISHPLSEGVFINPGDLPPIIHQGHYLISDLHLSSHTGMHNDALHHYRKSVDIFDTIPLSCLIDRCRVLDVTGAGTITASHLKSRVDGVCRFLINMDIFGKDRFDEIYPALGPDVAHMITGPGMNCVGN